MHAAPGALRCIYVFNLINLTCSIYFCCTMSFYRVETHRMFCHWKNVLLFPSCLLSIFPCRINGGNYPRKIRSRYQSLPLHLSHRPGVRRSGTMAASRRTEGTIDRTAKRLHSLPARSRSSMAAQHSQYSESDKQKACVDYQPIIS